MVIDNASEIVKFDPNHGSAARHAIIAAHRIHPVRLIARTGPADGTAIPERKPRKTMIS
jgi:hypothetical protein